MTTDPAAATSRPPLLPTPDTGFEEQYRASLESAVILERSDVTTIEASGADAVGFLQNMLSASVDGLADGTGTAATFLTNKGKLVAVLTVFRDGGRFRIETEASRTTPFIEQISRFIISEDVSLEPIAAEGASASFVGPMAGAWIGNALGLGVADMNHLDVRQAPASMDARVISRAKEPSPRFDVVGSDDAVRTAVDAGLAAGAIVGGEALAETRRVESGRPRFGVDIDETHMPLEAALDDAIHFDKGCYIGQEYVVRLAHRGQLQKKLVGVLVNGDDAPLCPAAVQLDDRDIGTLTSARFSPRLQATAALGLLHRNAFPMGTNVAVTFADGSTKDGVVSSLPFEPV